MKSYDLPILTDAEAKQALAAACEQVETNLPLYTYQCQNHSSVNGIYPGCANNQWTCGFWPGEMWLAYEATGDEKFKTAALIQVDSFADRIARKVEVDHHDMGFLYSPTCVAAWKLVGSEKGRSTGPARRPATTTIVRSPRPTPPRPWPTLSARTAAPTTPSS